MAGVTGRLGDAAGVVVLEGDDSAVMRALDEAAQDHAPVVVIASRAPRAAASAIKTTIGAGADSASHWIAHAAQAAMSEPRGPVWLVVAADVAVRAALPVATAARRAASPPDPRQIDAIARHVAGASRPLVVAGRGCRSAATAGWLRAFSETLPAPVLVTPAARGVLPDPHPLCFGVLNGYTAILRRADLVVALGVDEDELDAAGVDFTTPVVRLGRTPAWTRSTAVAEAEGDVALLLEELAPRLRDGSKADWDVAEIDRLRRALPPPAVDATLAGIVTRLREATPAGTAAVFARDLAAATPLWQAVNPGELLVADASVPAAIAVALERPESAVLALTRGEADREPADAAMAGVRMITIEGSGNIAFAIGPALSAPRPSVIVVVM